VRSVFTLPERLAAKADPALITADEEHFAAIEAGLARSIAELDERLDAERKAPGGIGRRALDRDQEIRRLSARLRTLGRYRLDLCLGRMDPDGGEPVYVGRLGLTDDQGRRLLVDWRSPAAEPFFAATHANPAGLRSRRRYRWAGGRITDYWDEIFTLDELTNERRNTAALDDQSAFIASLGADRSGRMRDVLGTIQADQDAIIRASSGGALVVDGGPGTGKTVVALHRAAYLLYSDPRLGERHGGLLFVGPHEPYLAYVADVLPSLGEQDVQTCTLRDLVPEGAAAAEEKDPAVKRLKSDARLVEAIEAAVRFYEAPPTSKVLGLTAADWAQAFEAPGPGTPHNEARDEIWDELLTILENQDPDFVRDDVVDNRELTVAFTRAWPLLDPEDLVADLWSVPAYLRKCAPWLTVEEIRTLQRADPRAWTVEDLPLLDAARQRLGDPGTSRRRRQQVTAARRHREGMSRVIDDLLDANTYDDGEGLWTMLRGEDMRNSLDDDTVLPRSEPDRMAGPFAHIVVDEAQELTDAEWQMLLRRCPSRSFTIVGDRAQARQPFTESWTERLNRIGLDRVAMSSLTINYRTPEEVMAEAEPVIRAALPDANVPVSIRRSGLPVVHKQVRELRDVVNAWLAGHAEGEGVACVIGDPSFAGTERVRSLSPELAKGLEFDLVVLVEPAKWTAVDRYVAMTRATQQLVVLTR
jgi:hypothetical protein